MKSLISVPRMINRFSYRTTNYPAVSLLQNKTFSPDHVSARTNLGYIPFEGRTGRYLESTELFLLDLRKTNLQPVKKMTFSFDPMREDYHSIRNLTYFLHMPKVLETNRKVAIKTEIVDDRREPVITFTLNDGRDLEIKTGNLTELEIIYIINHYLLPLVVEEKAGKETKSGKAGGKSAGVRKKK